MIDEIMAQFAFNIKSDDSKYKPCDLCNVNP